CSPGISSATSQATKHALCAVGRLLTTTVQCIPTSYRTMASNSGMTHELDRLQLLLHRHLLPRRPRAGLHA
ncbi:MAG TPA: hypothetical protein PKA06_17000, partial [Gemmatales bacterium]|nr:hypothetical protein [Gemmatales bacterium]